MNDGAPRSVRCRLATATLALAAACGGPVVIPLRSANTVKSELGVRQPGLEVVTQSTQASDPLPVSGTNVSYGAFESTLRQAVATAAAPWATESWRVSLDIITAEAEYADKRLSVSIGLRATLRAKQGNVYLGQTEVACRDSATLPPEKGHEVVRSCLMQLAGGLTGWLGAVDTESPATAEPDDPKVVSGAVGASGSSPADGDGDGAGPSGEGAEGGGEGAD